MDKNYFRKFLWTRFLLDFKKGGHIVSGEKLGVNKYPKKLPSFSKSICMYTR